MLYREDKLNQYLPNPISLEGAKKILYQMQNCVCKIYIEKKSMGIGFLCKIPYKDYPLEVLITNNHILNEKYIENNQTIEIRINKKFKQIKIDKTRKKYISKSLNVTILEIKPNCDNIKANNFMEIDEDINKNMIELEKKSIYILSSNPEEQICISFGLINVLKNEKNKYYCNIEGSSCFPILSLESFKIIGIHNGNSKNANIKLNDGIIMKYVIDEFNYNIKETKNEINLIYSGDDNYANLFGEEFVKNNKDNIDLEINGLKSDIISNYKLKKGENNIKIIIKNKLTNFSNMFFGCNSLINIKELEYLDTKDGLNFSYMFGGCSSLSNIKALINWNVSNGNNFQGMFLGCSSLSDIKPLKNWNVSNGINFSCLFSRCTSLSDIKTLQNWNVSNGNNFSCMFWKCSSLSDIKPLQNWNVSNGNNFSYIFRECSELSDIKPLQNWDVSKGINFSCMFNECSSLSDIKPLQNWNVSNVNNFSYMFARCSLLTDIKSLQNWNVSNGINFSFMFAGCSSLSDIKPLQNWNVSNGNNFSYMFYECGSLSDIKSLQNWNVSNVYNFSHMFDGCSLLSNINALQNWDVSSGNKFKYMFWECSSLSDIKPLEFWNLSKGNDFSGMFDGCSSLSDIKPLEKWNIYFKINIKFN